MRLFTYQSCREGTGHAARPATVTTMSEYRDTPFERALATGDAAFRDLADFAPVMIWRSGTDALCDWFNKPWLDFTGKPMKDEVGEGWAQGVHPDDYDRCMAIYLGAFQAREPFSMEYRLRRHDGEYVWLLDNGAPYYRDDRFAGYWGSCVDVSAHREAQQAQRILINELNHRVKNTLAVVQAIAAQSFREDRSLAESRQTFDQRLLALAGAHDLLISRAWEEVALRAVVESTIAPHDPGGDRIQADGPALMLRPETSVSIAMALHELLTNAGKYGALSTARGTVRIDWSYRETSGGMLRIEWKESGGPPVHLPSQRGFGTRFIERVLADQARGMAQVRFEPDGVRCVFEAPARAGARLASRLNPATASAEGG